ncbi:hypothetical protein BpHYR1_004892 [Brachionus plicatilis]|uniref:Uncharacterized protein n=1 Tax=Brachionus plicatilis TaxID=10195 RepID=A0A3M7RQK2_BRAPC|nr:hypothetical protein BpHYR1_004892 [Brachionus plicatilis]
MKFFFILLTFLVAQKHQNFKLLEAPKRSFLKPYKISMILAAKHRKKSHFDSLVLLVRPKILKESFWLVGASSFLN